VRWLERSTRRLARSIFATMMSQQAKLERRQRLLARIVDIGAELTAVAASCALARTMSKGASGAASQPGDAKPLVLADVFCRGARRRVDELFRGLSSNDDLRTWKLAQSIVAGEHSWLEQGVIDLHAHAAAAAREDDGARRRAPVPEGATP
jgi:hypothetical protein